MNLVTAKLNPGALVAFGSVTASYTLVTTVQGPCVLLDITHSFNQACVLSLDGGVTDHIFLVPNITVASQPVNFGANGTVWAGSIFIKHLGAAPTGGAVGILPVRRA